MLIVEDGTGMTNAESYADVLKCDEYAAKYGYMEAWASVPELKEAHLRNATMYLDLTFREWFLGKKKNKEQALEFPRIEISIVDSVPLHILNACCECACQLAKGVDLYAGNVPQIKRQKVDVIEKEFFETSNTGRTGNFKIEGMISSYLRRKNAITTVSGIRCG